MTPEEQFDRVFASAMQDRQALRRFLDGITTIQARWHPPDGEWSILEGLGLEIATPADAREILALKGSDQVAF